MGWAAIISAILAIVGPLIAEWLKKWLESRLHKVAERMPFVSFGDDQAAAIALLERAVEDTSRFMFAKRMVLRRALAAVRRPNGLTAPLSPEDAAELADVAALADDE